MNGGSELSAGVSAELVKKIQEAGGAVLVMFNTQKASAVQASIRLRVADVLVKAEFGEGKPGLTAEEIVERLPGRKSPGGAEIASNLRRLLEPLVLDGLYIQSVLPNGKATYSTTYVSKLFVQDTKSNKFSGIFGFKALPLYQKAASCIEYAILDDAKSPFEIANGKSFYEVAETEPKLSAALTDTMIGLTELQMPEFIKELQKSGELQDVKTVVDVGGAVGTLVCILVDANPPLHGINFDLPHVISEAEPHHSVQQVAGDFAKNIPEGLGDAMLLKFILHNNGDEASIQILQRCYKALPEHGKLFVVELFLPEIDEQNPDVQRKTLICLTDFVMMACFRAGRERTFKEYKELITAAGFSGVKLISKGILSILVAYKSKH